eukprot:1729822-Rhodomonas_salina.4
MHLIPPSHGSYLVERVGDGVIDGLPALEHLAFRGGHDAEHELALLALELLRHAVELRHAVAPEDQLRICEDRTEIARDNSGSEGVCDPRPSPEAKPESISLKETSFACKPDEADIE